MSDKLKDFVEANRDGFDCYEPGSEVWLAVSAAANQHASSIFLKKPNTMFKIGFGASALVIGTLVVLNLPQNKQQSLAPVTPAIEILPTQPGIDTPETRRVSEPIVLPPLPASPKAFASVGSNEQPPVPPAGEVMPAMPDLEIVTEAPPAFPAEEVATPEPVSPAGNAVVWQANDDTLNEKNTPDLDTLFNGIKKLQVDGDYCSIEIKGVDGDQLAMRVYAGKVTTKTKRGGKKTVTKQAIKARYKKEGDLLKVWIEPTKNCEKDEDADVCNYIKESARLNFEVPVKTEVVVHNQSGKVKVSRIESQKVTLETNFGRIEADNIVGGLELKSASGPIKLHNITGNIKARADFGSMTIRDVKGNLVLNSSSGSIKLGNIRGDVSLKTSYGSQVLDSITGNVDSHSASGSFTSRRVKGNITIQSTFGRQTYEDIEGDIKAHAGSGSINVDKTTGKLMLSADFGSINGKNVKVTTNSEFKTSSGSIKMNLLNEMKDLHFVLEASSGRVNVEKENYNGKSTDRLDIGAGPILIKGSSVFGSQHYN